MAKLITTAYTDYPDRVIREIKILSFDNNKYAKVQHLDGVIEEIKVGYLRTDKAFTRTIPKIDLFIHGGGKRHVYRPRFGKTKYEVGDSEDAAYSRDFTSKAKAVAYAVARAQATGREFHVCASERRQYAFRSGHSTIYCTPFGQAIEFNQTNYRRGRKFVMGKSMRGYGKMTSKHTGKRPRCK